MSYWELELFFPQPNSATRHRILVDSTCHVCNRYCSTEIQQSRSELQLGCWRTTLSLVLRFLRCWYAILNLIYIFVLPRFCAVITALVIEVRTMVSKSLPMSAWCGATVSFRLHPVHHWFQLTLSSVVVILTASGPTYAAVHRRQSHVFGDWKPPLEQSAIYWPQFQCWLFFGTASKHTFSPDHFLTKCFRFLVLYTVYSSGLAVLYLGHAK